MCALASLAFVCLNQQASAQQQSQHALANPHLENVFVPSDRANLNCIGCHSLSNSHSENVKVRSDQLYQSLVSGGGLSWFQLANPYMGMSLTPADDALRAHLQLPKDQGLIVTSLDIHSPAAQAGIQQNDILLDLENASLGKPEDLEKCLKAAGDKPLPLTILRSGKKLTIEVQPRVSVDDCARSSPSPLRSGSESRSHPSGRRCGATQYPSNEGLLAVDVIKDSPASQAEIKIHDILLTLSGQPLDRPRQARRDSSGFRRKTHCGEAHSRRENTDLRSDAAAEEIDSMQRKRQRQRPDVRSLFKLSGLVP